VGGYEAADEGGTYYNLMVAVEGALDQLPVQERRKSEWCEASYGVIEEAAGKRNAAASGHARTKTVGEKERLKVARKELKRDKVRAKNLWLLDMATAGNHSLLPGPGGRKTEGCIFKMARKLINGIDKFRVWQGGNVRNEEGVLAGNAEANADNFQAFYAKLLHNKGDTGRGFEEYKRMKHREVDRQFRPPIMAELVREIRNSKDAAPGENGVPALVWKAMLGEPHLLETMLNVMQ
jgi:hypothetical protein